MKIRVIDFETTGLPADGAAIVEAAYCDVEAVDGKASVAGLPVSFLCNPGVPIPALARAVHHISDDDIRDAKSPDEVFRHLTPEKADQVFYCGHNADFERAFFAPQAPWICTYKVALRLWPDAPAHGNQVLRYHLGLDLDDPRLASPPHRAGPDSYVTAHLLARAINENRATIAEMHRWADGPALLPRLPFGKHKGAKWEDVPADYLDWIANKSDLDRDVKANARHHLKRRVSA